MKRFLPLVLGVACFFALALTTANAQQIAANDDASCGSPALTASQATMLAKAQLGMWGTGDPLPIPKKYHVIASAGGCMYVFAGVTTNNYYNAKSYKYDPAVDAWTPIKDFPVTKFINGIAQTINGKIYITGGLENINSAYKALTVCYEYDPAADKYTLKAAMPQPQGYAASGVIDNKLYVIAGLGAKTTDSLDIVQVYDPATNSWSTSTPYPRHLFRFPGATVNNKIITSGGFTANYSFRYVADTYIGEVVGGTLTWTKGKDYPIGPTIYMTGAGLGEYAYFFSGQPSIDGNAPATQRAFRYKVSDDTWETLEFKPTGVNQVPQGAVIGNKVYAAGGEAADGTVLDVNEYIDAQAQPGSTASCSPTAIDRWVQISTPATFKVKLKNMGSAELTWTASTATPWISFQRSSGTAGTMGGTDVLEIIVNASQLAVGTFSGAVDIATNDATHPLLQVNLTIHTTPGTPEAQPVVLIEEGTGTWCGYCPYGADSVKAILNQWPGRVLAIAYHNGDVMTTPWEQIWSGKTGLTFYPGACINRIKFPGNAVTALSRDQWGARVQEVLDTRVSPVTITVTNSSYNAVTKQIDLTVDVDVHQTLANEVRLSVAQLQDRVYWTQTFYPPTGGTTKLNPYEHNHVLQQLIPDEYGVVINSLSAPVAFNTKVTKQISFVSLDSVPETSKLVLFVHNCDGDVYGDILQATEIDVSAIPMDVKMVADPASFELLQNYPNPFNPTTTIAYNVGTRRNVRITVYDMFGREIETLVDGMKEPGMYSIRFDGMARASGSYMITMKAGDFTQTRIMTLVK